MKFPTALVPTKVNGRLKFQKVAIVVAHTGSPLAITQCSHDESMLTITHLPTGRKLPVAHHDQGELTQLLERLVELEWPMMASDIKENRELGRRCRAIIDDWIDAFQGDLA